MPQFEKDSDSMSSSSAFNEEFKTLDIVFKESNALKTITQNVNSSTTYLYMGGKHIHNIYIKIWL